MGISTSYHLNLRYRLVRYAGRPSQESGDPFQMDNRAGISGTLHRISAIRGQSGDVIGLTYRIGRHIAGDTNIHERIYR